MKLTNRQIQELNANGFTGYVLEDIKDVLNIISQSCDYLMHHNKNYTRAQEVELMKINDIVKAMQNAESYPAYVRRGEFIGAFAGFDGGFPCYRFPGGVSVVEDIEIENGSDIREELEKQIIEEKQLEIIVNSFEEKKKREEEQYIQLLSDRARSILQDPATKTKIEDKYTKEGKEAAINYLFLLAAATLYGRC